MKRSIIAESTAWYHKTHLTFSDLFQAVREELGDIKHITNSLVKYEFANKLKKEDLFEDFSRASGF